MSDDDATVETLENLMISFDAGDVNDRPRAFAHDECYTMNRSVCHRFAQQTVSAIREGRIPGLCVSTFQSGYEDAVHKLAKAREEITDLKARLDISQREREALMRERNDAIRERDEAKALASDCVNERILALNQRDAAKSRVRDLEGLLLECVTAVNNIRNEHKTHGHITDASAEWAIITLPKIYAMLAGGGK